MRIGRVHQDDAGGKIGIEQFVDQLAIMAGKRGLRKQVGKAFPAERRDFIQGKTGTGGLGPHRQHPRASRWFERHLGWAEGASACGKPGEVWRCGKLLQLDLLFASHSLARQLGSKPVKHVPGCFGR